MSYELAGVIYAIDDDGDLWWYRHDGWYDGSDRWSPTTKVGYEWSFNQVFSGGAGVIYAITHYELDPRTGAQKGGRLYWYRHNGAEDGADDWPARTQVGHGWDFRQVFSGGAGVIYAITHYELDPRTGARKGADLWWYRHDGWHDGSDKWSPRTKIGHGWNFKQVFSGGDGVIYAIDDDGDLWWYRHGGADDGSDKWPPRTKVGHGWNFKQVFSGGDGVIYAIDEIGDLWWYRHDGWHDGIDKWSPRTKIGHGWNFRQVFSPVYCAPDPPR